MKIRLMKGRPASPNDLAAIQQKLGSGLPPEFLEFVAQNDGAEPETNIFKVGSSNEAGVNGFIPITEVSSEMEHIENLPPKTFPFAWAEGGNYLLLSLAEEGSIYFWDHERPANMIRLATSFGRFLDLIEPFDVKSMKLKPGQVKKAWIDPDFLKGLDG